MQSRSSFNEHKKNLRVLRTPGSVLILHDFFGRCFFIVNRLFF